MSKNTRNRILLTAVAALLLVIMTVGGTLAYLTAQTNAITNTFEPTSIDIDLAETTEDYDMVPGATIAKDPKVTVTNADVVDVYAFVQITKSDVLDNYISYTVADGWNQLKDENDKDVEGVFYREVKAADSTKTFSVLANDQVTVKTTVSSTMMEDLAKENAVQPTLTFQAYAIQSQYLETGLSMYDLWQMASGTTN